MHIDKPWGWYEVLAEGKDYLCKRLHLNPHSKTSLQSHARRVEFMYYAGSCFEVQCGDKTERVFPGNPAVKIPTSWKHRVINNSALPIELVEVWIGAQSDEEDIIRYEDDYGRV